MGLARGYLLLSLAPLACGPVSDRGDDTTTGAATTTATDLTTGAPITSGTTAVPDPTSSDTTAIATTGEPTTGEPTTSEPTTGSSTTGSSTTGAPLEIHYRAYTYAGGYDRLIVQKIDPVAGRCTAISFVLANKPPVPEYDISAPPEWQVERVRLTQDLSECEGFFLLPPVFDSLSGAGAVSWGDDFFAQIVDIDVTLTFAQDEPWKPAEEHLFAVGLATEN
jgi:hypothetical protein